jgi:hypothetical protein
MASRTIIDTDFDFVSLVLIDERYRSYCHTTGSELTGVGTACSGREFRIGVLPVSILVLIWLSFVWWIFIPGVGSPDIDK